MTEEVEFQSQVHVRCEKNVMFLHFTEDTLKYMLEHPTQEAVIPVNAELVLALLGTTN